MDEARKNRITGIVGLVVLVALAVGVVLFAQHRAGPPPPDFVAGEVSSELRGATIDLIGYPPGGEASLEDATTIVTRSVSDMSTLDDAAYLETWERSAEDQAELVGRWLGLANHELGDENLQEVVATALDVQDSAPAGLDDTLQAAFDRAADG